MGKIIVTFTSVTYAMKVRKALAKEGINAKLVKVGDENRRGCTHGIEITNGEFLSVIGLLRNLGIEYSVYNS